MSISWSAPSTKPSRTVDWYWTLGALTAVLVGYSIWNANWLFALFILLAVLVVVLRHQKSPKAYEVEIRENGLVVNESFLPYNRCASFAVRVSQHKSSLVLYPSSMLSGHVAIPLGGMNPETVYAALLEYLPEHPHEETWIEMLADRLGF